MKYCWSVVIVVFAAGCKSGSSYDRDAADLPSALQAAKIAGLPTTADDLARKVTPAQNAAIEYRRAFATKLPKNLPWVQGNWDGVRKLTSTDLDSMRKSLAKLSAGLDWIKAASRKSHCDFERDWTLGAAATFPELSDMKNWQKALSAATIVAGAQGDAGDVRQYTKAMFSMSSHLFEGDSLIDQLVGIAVARIACRGCAQAISQAPNPKVIAAAVYDGMMPMSLRYEFARPLRGESIGLSSTFRHVASGTPIEQFFGDLSGKDAGIAEMKKVDRQVLAKALEARMWRWHLKVSKVIKSGTTLEQARQIQQLAKEEKSPFVSDIWSQYAAAGVGYVYATSSLLLGAQIVANGRLDDAKWQATANKIGLSVHQVQSGVWVEPIDVNIDGGPSNFKSLNTFRYPFTMPEPPVNK